MTPAKLLLALILFLAGTPQFVASQDLEEEGYRTFSLNNGDTLSGTYRGKSDDVVKLRANDGSLTSLRYSELIADDQKFIDGLVAKYGVSPGTHIWTDTNGRRFHGELTGISGSQIRFLLFTNDQTINMEAMFVSPKDLGMAVERVNRMGVPPGSNRPRYRVWEYAGSNGNTLKCIGQLAALDGDRLTLNQLGQQFQITVPSLSRADIDYLVGDPSIANAIPDFQRKQIDPNRRRQYSDEEPEEEEVEYGVPLIWWISIGIVALLLLGIIAVKYISESNQPEWDDD